MSTNLGQCKASAFAVGVQLYSAMHLTDFGRHGKKSLHVQYYTVKLYSKIYLCPPHYKPLANISVEGQFRLTTP